METLGPGIPHGQSHWSTPGEGAVKATIEDGQAGDIRHIEVHPVAHDPTGQGGTVELLVETPDGTIINLIETLDDFNDSLTHQ